MARIARATRRLIEALVNFVGAGLWQLFSFVRKNPMNDEELERLRRYFSNVEEEWARTRPTILQRLKKSLAFVLNRQQRIPRYPDGRKSS